MAIHCAANSTLCSTDNGGFLDKLPWEPNPDGSAATIDPATGTSSAYEGYNALFGHKYVTQAFRNLGLGSNVLDANGNLKDINGNTIVDDFNGVLTPGFPGFGIAPQYSLGYVADMLEAGVPVVYAYINGATGDLTSIGEADLVSGQIVLRYSGKICFAKAD